MFYANIYRIGNTGKLIHQGGMYVNDIPHAEAVCWEYKERDKEGRDFLVSVLCNMREKVIHTFSTTDYSRKRA